MPHLKPVGHQSTNWMVRLVLMVATAALTSLGTTSPRYIRQHAMYLPWRGSTLQSMRRRLEAGLVISATDSCSWYAFSAEITGRVRATHEVDARVRHQVGLELGHVDVERAVEAERRGERRDDLREQAVEVGVRRALDVEVAAADVVEASLSTMNETSVCSSSECVESTQLYGSTTAVETCGRRVDA